MAYFCPHTGVRLVAPGTFATYGGPAFDDALPHHHEAEQAAATVLASNPHGPHAPPDDALIERARKAALGLLLSREQEAAAKPLESPKAPDEAQPHKPKR